MNMLVSSDVVQIWVCIRRINYLLIHTCFLNCTCVHAYTYFHSQTSMSDYENNHYTKRTILFVCTLLIVTSHYLRWHSIL